MLVGYGVVIGLAVWVAFSLAGRIARLHRHDRHQRHDAPDGPAARRARGRGDVGRAGQAVPGAGESRADERRRKRPLRLHRLRRRHRRLPARQPAERRPDQARAADRGRRQGRLPLGPHPGRLSVLHRQPAHRLALRDRARCRAQRPQPALSARQGARRLQQHQRHDLHARPGARLRRLGRGDGLGANPGWSWSECLPYFLKHEDFYKGADAFHAAPGFDPTGRRPGGEWRVEKQRLHWPILDAFVEAAVEAGHPALDDFNRGDNEGVGYFDVNQRAGIRWNATKAFLRPAFPRRNLQVWTGAHINRVLFDGVRASGVEVGAARRQRARRRPRRRRRGRSSRRARSAARRSCSSRASATRRCWRATGSRRRTSCPASARTCRTTCRSAPSTASKARRR